MTEISRVLGALAAFARLGWREAASDRFGLFGRMLLYSLPVLIFGAIWRATPLADSGHDAERLTWYVMVTEAIIFAPGYVFREVEEDIRSGAIEAALTRPLSYGLARIAEETGGTLFRLVCLGVYGWVLAWLATGIVPFAWTAVPALALAMIFGALLSLLFQVVIGFLTAWMGTPAPVYWIWQKVVFVIGGLFIPLTLYPAWIREFGIATPFAAILYHPASLVLEARPEAILAALAWQGLWLAAAALLVAAIATAATRRFVREGV
jgi:ABC-2 type transport system permease protein